MATLENLKFDNSYQTLPEKFYRVVQPTPLPEPYLVSFNAEVAKLIGLDISEVSKSEFLEYFAGNKTFSESTPISAIYAGHQFGSYVPQLGDGRAILLGEVLNENGERFDVQLKGAGQTPFSRMGDGRAVLRSTIREYLCSEAMFGLGISTTRALCIVGSDAPVYRETVETAAVLTRISPSHVRFGSFEVFYYRGQHEQVQQLADYVIREFYPHLAETEIKYLEFLREVISRTAKLLANWQAVGFAHGVMNTDNMSILGLTIDYGPFGFLDEFDSAFICNHSDHAGRYAFNQQPVVALWNLSRLAQALVPLIEPEAGMAALDEYEAQFIEEYYRLMSAKIGLSATDENVEIINEMLGLLQTNKTDYTVFFRRLCDFRQGDKNDYLQRIFLDEASFAAWAKDYEVRLKAENSDDKIRSEMMKKVNPKYILRNHLAQQAIEKAEEKDYSEVDLLLKVLQNPFDEQPEMERFAEPPPLGMKKVEVSCSS